ncbi:MAG TPA: hypothetical protein VGH00_08975 [Chthoniobacterales bacterium]
MRTKFIIGLLLVAVFAGGALAAVVVEKKSRQLPYVEVFECQGIHSFIFRGPTGTSRRPILVPPEEYWTAREAGLYSFVLRYHSGNVRSRLVTPEVFARYQVGNDFRDGAPASESYQTEDNKTAPPLTHHRRRTAQLRRHPHSSHRVATHHRHHRSARLAAR